MNKVALTVVHPHGTDSKTLDSNYDSVKQANVSFTGSKKSAPIDVSKVKTYRAANNFEIQLNETNSDNVEYSFTMGEKDWTPKKQLLLMCWQRSFLIVEQKVNLLKIFQNLKTNMEFHLPVSAWGIWG